MSMERDYDLGQRMRELGAPDPDDWASSESEDDIAQEARWLVIRQVRAVATWTIDNLRSVPTVAQLLDAGADPDTVLSAVREVASETAFSVLDVIDEHADPDAPPDAPGWVLMEVRFDKNGEPVFTGRDIPGLHEDLGLADTGDQSTS